MLTEMASFQFGWGYWFEIEASLIMSDYVMVNNEVHDRNLVDPWTDGEPWTIVIRG